jgi:serine O-acetyltransferase
MWRVSTGLHARGHGRLARARKGLNYLLFRALLPGEAELGARLHIINGGLGIVVHPNVSIGDAVAGNPATVIGRRSADPR